eukprot:1160878-Pelagomonas_calceolata.AAC.9
MKKWGIGGRGYGWAGCCLPGAEDLSVSDSEEGRASEENGKWQETTFGTTNDDDAYLPCWPSSFAVLEVLAPWLLELGRQLHDFILNRARRLRKPSSSHKALGSILFLVRLGVACIKLSASLDTSAQVVHFLVCMKSMSMTLSPMVHNTTPAFVCSGGASLLFEVPGFGAASLGSHLMLPLQVGEGLCALFSANKKDHRSECAITHAVIANSRRIQEINPNPNKLKQSLPSFKQHGLP